MVVFIEFGPEWQTLGARLQKAMRELGDYPMRNTAKVQELVTNMVDNNFDLLGMGAGVQSAGGGMVQWPLDRAPITKAERQMSGVGNTFPMLQVTGDLKQGYTSGLQAGLLSDGVAFRGNPFVESIGRKHQFGETGDAHFPNIGKRYLDWQFPERPFFFWNRNGATAVREDIRQNFWPRVKKQVFT